MVLIILLIISIILQLFAASVAIKLTRVTKFNSSWFLITIALVFMCVMRLDEFIHAIAARSGDKDLYLSMPIGVYTWFGVATSLCFAVGVFMIKKILTYMTLREQQQRNSDMRILNAVIKAEEQQRQYFSKELHDGLGPLLSTVKMSISALSKVDNSDSSKEIIANTDHAISLAIRSLREISNNLSPHILNNFGVERAINNFINRLRPVIPTLINYNSNLKGERFDSDRETITYRIVCELINNGLKHAHATDISLSLSLIRESLTISYKDNGCGFDTETQYDGMGLSNIKSRISSIKGDISILSDIGDGTVIHIRLRTRD